MSSDYIAKMSPEDRARKITNYSNTLVGMSASYDDVQFLSKLIKNWRYNLDLFDNFRYSNGADHYVSGINGEQLNVPINLFRAHINAKHNLVSKPVALKCSAIEGGGTAANIDCEKGDRFLEYYLRFRNFHDVFDTAILLGNITGTGAVFCEWDDRAGPQLSMQLPDVPQMPGLDGGMSPDQQIMASKPIFAGDFSLRALTPFQLYAPPIYDDWSRVPFCVVTTFENKYEMAARYGDLGDDVVSKIMAWSGAMFNNIYYQFSSVSSTARDFIPVRKYYHRRVPGSEEAENGQHTIVLGDDIVCFDGDNPYAFGDGSDLPVFIYKPIKWAGTWYGQTEASDLAPLQYMTDVNSSSIATNIAQFGVPNIFGSYSGFEPTTLNNGAQYYYFPEGTTPPQSMNLMPDLSQLNNNSEFLIKGFQMLSGMNPVSMGQNPTDLKSGVALGIMDSQSVKAATPAIKSKVKMYEDESNFMLKVCRKNMTTPRMIAIAGKDGSNKQMEFSGHDLNNIQAYYGEAVDPMQETTAGKFAMLEAADPTAQANPYDRSYVLQYGKWPKSYLSKAREENLAESENENLKNGKVVQALPIDVHPVHIPIHKELLEDPDMRDDFVNGIEPNASIYKNTMDHMQAHEQLMAPPPMMGPPGMAPPGPPPPGIPLGGHPMPPKHNDKHEPTAHGSIPPGMAPIMPPGPALPPQ